MKITISGSASLDGEYEAVLREVMAFTNDELHDIKKHTGLRAGELDDALDAGDNDMAVALVVVALQRMGKTMVWEELGPLAPGGITLDVEDDLAAAKADAGPPILEPEESKPSSGAASSANGDASQGISAQPPSGSPVSETGSDFDRLTLAK